LKIVFINPNRHQGAGRPPLGLLSVASTCRAFGHSVRILDADMLNLEARQIRIADEEVVGLTAMTPTIAEAFKIAGVLRGIGYAGRIILGGVHASIFPDAMAHTGLFDTIIAGPGERAIIQYLLDIKTNSVKQTYNMPVDMRDIPLPDYSILPVLSYKPRYPHGLAGPWTCASTSRGCPYHCTFCSKAVFGNKYQAMDTSRVMDVLYKLVKNYGIKDITFYDDEFTLNHDRVLDFCDSLIRRKLDLKWTCEARVNLVDEELISAMQQAGCRLINYGIESGSQSVLDSLRKDITIEQVRTAVALTRRYGIRASGYFMLGCPGETKETVSQTVEFAQSLELDHAQFSVCWPLPGSELYNEYIKTHAAPDWTKVGYLGGCVEVPFATFELPAEWVLKAVETANGIFNWKVK
jgi:anaerobic magnesium-protoporphyrin IX monomethyl ester cyclase